MWVEHWISIPVFIVTVYVSLVLPLKLHVVPSGPSIWNGLEALLYIGALSEGSEYFFPLYLSLSHRCKPWWRARTSVTMKKRITTSIPLQPRPKRGYGKHVRQCHSVTSNHVTTVTTPPALQRHSPPALWAVRPNVTSNGQGLVFTRVSASGGVTWRVEAV